MEIVQDIINKGIFKKGERVAVALSGGADSVALLMILLEVKKQMDIDVLAFHINHSIREESDEEQKYVKKLLDKLNVEAYFFTIDKSVYKKSGKSLEEIARKHRYEFFDKKAKELSCIVALGHHLEDQSETVLFHILRGTGLSGLIGMKERQGNYLRPLLDYRKKELIDFLKSREIDFVTDSSNFDTKYSRNKIREDIIPYIDRELGVDSNKKIHEMSKLIKADEDFLNDYVEKKYNELVLKENDKISLDLKGFVDLSLAIQRRLVRRCIFDLYPSLKDISFINVNDVIGLSKSENGRINLVNNIIVSRVYNKLVFKFDIFDDNAIKEYYIDKEGIVQKLNIDGKFIINVLSREEFYNKYEKIPNKAFKKYFDYDKFKRTIFLRSRKVKDYISIKGGKKSIKKLFIDEKIPYDDRDSVYLLGSGNSVAWVVGYRIGEEYKVSSDSKKILEIEYIGENQWAISK